MTFRFPLSSTKDVRWQIGVAGGRKVSSPRTARTKTAMQPALSHLIVEKRRAPNQSLQELHFPLAFRFMFANNVAMAITRRQREVYDFISRFVTENGYSPSFEEIGNGLKLNSLATVHKHISNLEKKGLLTRDYNRSRSIDLLPPKGKLKQSMSVNTGVVLPLMGRIAAGQPIEAVET